MRALCQVKIKWRMNHQIHQREMQYLYSRVSTPLHLLGATTRRLSISSLERTNVG
jgi:hypothetical protein